MEEEKGCEFILLVINNFGEHGFSVPIKNKTAETVTNEFSLIIHKSTCNSVLIEADDRKQFLLKIYKEL